MQPFHAVMMAAMETCAKVFFGYRLSRLPSLGPDAVKPLRHGSTRILQRLDGSIARDRRESRPICVPQVVLEFQRVALAGNGENGNEERVAITDGAEQE